MLSPKHTATPCRHYRTGELLVVDGPVLRAPAPGEGTSDLFIAPGLLDIQINGYKNVNFIGEELTVEGVAAVFADMAAVGVPFFCPTLVTTSPDAVLHGLRTIEAACAQDPALARANAGYHLEGPWIASEDGPRGAHPKEWTRDPCWEEFQRFQEAANGKVKIVTLAPEREGAIPFIARLAENHVVAALGHCGPTSEQVTAAADAGATLATHLGNGAHAMLPRHPNYIWDQLADDRLFISIIADGFHLPPNVVKVMTRAKGVPKTILISDIFVYSGLAPGRYRLDDNRQVEITENGRIGLYGTPFLSGANATVNQCVENTVKFAGVSLPDAIDMASLNAWRLLGKDLPAITPGSSTDALMLFRWVEEKLEIV